METTPQTMQEFFQRYEWKYETTDDENVLLSGFVDERETHYVLVVTLSELFVVFTVPYAEVPPTHSARTDIVTQLATLNYRWPMVKLSLDAESQILVSVELPRENFNYELFALALDLITESVVHLATILPLSTQSESEKAGVDDEPI